MDVRSFDISHLVTQFLCCSPLKRLIINNPKFDLDVDKQREILERTINCKLVKKYPIKLSYQRAFLKLLLDQAESRCDNIYDELYIAYCNIVSKRNDTDVHYRHFLMNSSGPLSCITLQENVNIITGGTTGLCSWQGGICLANWCTENKSEFEKKTILELGCGVGLTGLTVINDCSPSKYIFSDYHKSVLDMLCKNIKFNLSDDKTKIETASIQTNRTKLNLNYRNINVTVVKLNWENVQEYMSNVGVIPDVIIGADILYECSVFNALINTLRTFLHNGTSHAIIAATIRDRETLSQFLDLLGPQNLNYEQLIVPTETISIQSIDAPVEIFKIFANR